MTHDELNALEALEKEATKGPWKRFSKNGVVAVMKGARELIHWMGFDHDAGFKRKAAENVAFIATIRNAAPTLIALARCEIEREARVSTHAPGCHTWGPRHYDCLMRRYEATRAALTKAQEALEPIVAGMEDDPDYGPTVRMSAISQENMTRARSALDAIRKVLRS